MANASTIRRQIAGTQQLTIAPLLYTVTSTTETAFQLNNNGLTLTGGGVIPLSAGVTGLYAGTGQVLHVAATGKVTGATAGSSSLQLKLYQVPASLLPIADTLAGAQTFTSWNKIADSGSCTISQTQAGFTLDARLQLSANGNLTGEFTSQIDFTTAVVSWVKISTDVTGLVGEADLNFVVTATLSSGETVTLTEFRIDLE